MGCLDGKCGECCRTMRFELHSLDHRMWVELHDVQVVRHKGKYYAEFPVECTKLKGNLCSIYEDRPQMCRDFTCKEDM